MTIEMKLDGNAVYVHCSGTLHPLNYAESLDEVKQVLTRYFPNSLCHVVVIDYTGQIPLSAINDFTGLGAFLHNGYIIFVLRSAVTRVMETIANKVMGKRLKMVTTLEEAVRHIEEANRLHSSKSAR